MTDNASPLPGPDATGAETVRSAQAAWARGDVEGYLAHFADDMEFLMPGSTPFSKQVKGKAGFLEVVGDVMAHLKDGIALEYFTFIDGGDKIVTESYGTATTKDGKPYNNRYCHIWTVKNGRIAGFIEYNDTDLIMRTIFPHK